MDKKQALLNVTVAISTKVCLLLLSFWVRKVLIEQVGGVIGGLDTLYEDILNFLMIIELALVAAVNLAMYKAIVNHDQKTLAGIYHFYRQVMNAIGVMMLIVALVLMPLLPVLAKDYHGGAQLFISYLLTVATFSWHYFYCCRATLIDAYKNQYITTLFTALTNVLIRVLQIIVLSVWHSYELYLLVGAVVTLLNLILIFVYSNRQHREILKTKVTLASDVQQKIKKDTTAMLMHKLGWLITSAINGIIIAAFLGLELKNTYANYTMIITSMSGLLGLCFYPLTAIIGHLYVADEDASKENFHRLYFFNIAIGLIFFLGYYGVINSLISLWLGTDFLLERYITLFLTIYHFTGFIYTVTDIYRDATGTFYRDGWVSVVKSLVNIIAGIIAVYFWGIIGLLIETLLLNLLVMHFIYPRNLYKHAFRQKAGRYYLIDFGTIILFSGALIMLHYLMVDIGSVWLNFLINGAIAVGIAVVILTVILICSKKCRTYLLKSKRQLEAA